MPKVSVIIPVFNGANYVEMAIQAVKDQTFQDLELMVVDDGSIDFTGEVVQRYAWAPLQYIYQPNRGASAARNNGLRHSSGEYVIFLDADDWWDSRSLELLVTTLDSNPIEIGVAHADWAFADSERRVGVYRSSEFSHGEGLETLVVMNPIPIHAALIRREALVQVGGFTESIPVLEDWDLWLKIASAGYRFIHVPELLAYYHWHAGSQSKDLERRKRERLMTLDVFWARKGIPAPLLNQKNRAYASAYIDFSVAQFGQENFPSAVNELAQAFCFDKEIALDPDTYYRIAYADQAVYIPGQDGLRESIGEDTALQRIEIALSCVRKNKDGDTDFYRSASYAAFSALGLAHYSEGDFRQARFYLAKAFRIDPENVRNFSNLFLFLKSLLPYSILKFGKSIYGRLRKNPSGLARLISISGHG